MSQPHLNAPDEIAETARARSAGEWPEGFFEDVVGGWKGKPLQRPKQGRFEQRGEDVSSAQAALKRG